jgi:hypothetical protein
MPSNITASSVFTEPVQIPNNGEVASASDLLSTTIQPLVNRDQYLKDAVDELADYVDALRTRGIFLVTGSDVSDGSKFSISGSSSDPPGAFVTESDEITVTESGLYLLGIADVLASSSSTESNVMVGAILRQHVAGSTFTLSSIFGTRFSSNANHAVQFSMCNIVSLSAGVKLDLIALSRDESFSADGNVTLTSCRLSIHRIR